jgi:hypothetical protein
VGTEREAALTRLRMPGLEYSNVMSLFFFVFMTWLRAALLILEPYAATGFTTMLQLNGIDRYV